MLARVLHDLSGYDVRVTPPQMTTRFTPMRQHRSICWTLATGLLLALPVAGAQDTAKKLYCWNEGGRKVCGDALPATAVNSARTEINAKSGLASRQVGRAMSEAERLAARDAEDRAQQQDSVEQGLMRRDQAMVESYGTEADLRRAFNARIVLLDETVKASILGVTGMRQSLVSLLRQAGDAELAGKPVPKPLTESIRTQHAQLIRQQDLLQRQQADRAAVNVELNAALARYRELKTARPAIGMLSGSSSG